MSLPLSNKRNREEADFSDDDVPLLHRRLSRDSGVVSTPPHRPVNPDTPVGREGVVDVDEGGSDDASRVTLAGVQTGALAPFHDGRIIPDSVCTMEALAELRMLYRIPASIELSLPHRSYNVYDPPKGQLLIHKAAFECGVRLPLHPTLRRALVALGLAPLQISPGFWKHLTGFLVLWREQCERDKVDREPGLDEIRYIFQITSLIPRGQFYLRVIPETKFAVPGANVKYPHSWKEEWVVVSGDWGQTAYIGGAEHPVPTQFSLKDKWQRKALSAESHSILQNIIDRNFLNLKYPLLGPFEGSRLEASLRISDGVPGTLLSSISYLAVLGLFCMFNLVISFCAVSVIPPALPSPRSSGLMDTDPPMAIPLVQPSDRRVRTSAGSGLKKTASTPPVSVPSTSTSPATISPLVPPPLSLSSLLARAAKAWGSPSSVRDRTAETASAAQGMTVSPAAPPPPPRSSGPRTGVEKRIRAPRSGPSPDLPSGSGPPDPARDEVVDYFAAACPGGGLQNMVSIPSEVLAKKGAALMAEVYLLYSFLRRTFQFNRSFCSLSLHRASNSPWRSVDRWTTLGRLT